MDDKYQLLFEDLCARIPFHPIVSYFNRNLYLVGLSKNGNQITAYVKESLSDGVEEAVDFVLIKPYLRKMSDATNTEEVFLNIISFENPISSYLTAMTIKICHERHLDCLGQIERGLALEAPKGMYNFETENI